MATASTLIALAQERVGDPDGDHLTFARGLANLNEAQRKFVSQTWPLDRRKGFSVTARDDKISFPTELVMLEGVWLLKQQDRELRWHDTEDYRRRVSNLTTDSGDPRIYTTYERAVRVWPRFTSTSDASTIGDNAGQDPATTTLQVATTTSFKSAGRAIINALEEVEYTNKTASTLTGCTRGVGGTSAGSHATGVAITEVDLELWYRREPASIATGSDSPDIPEVWHEYLVPYIIYLEYLSLGRNEDAAAQLQVYAALEAEVGNNVKKRQIATLPRIRNRRIRF